MAQKILVVDDEANIRELAALYLQKEGFLVESAIDGEDALARFEASPPALVILDLMLPRIDGWEVCRRIRRVSDVPILMLTARSEDVDKIVGLELGADDYLTKPFNPREMVARVKAILRRADGRTRAARQVLQVANVTLDKARREVYVDGEPIQLRTKEFDLLAAFMENEAIVLTREQLLESVWGYEYPGETRTVDVHVQHLRQKLARAKVQIETLRGVGYKLVASGE